MDIVIFRENTEDVYAGIEWKEGTPEGEEADRLPQQRNVEGTARSRSAKIPAWASSRSPIFGTKRLVRQGDQVRAREKPQIGHAGSQRQHPEVH